MYRFMRTATVRNAASLPAAAQFAGEVTAHVNKRHGIAMRFGIESYGKSRVHWHFDIDSLDKMQQLNRSLMEDREYFGLLEKYKEVWVDGSVKDRLVVFPD